ncbi:hypothetical protein CYLTODRAFT_460196 [Cylindrobasidium torrendii FP15055 ss-10]|uniref:Uncharacterized protein n=1 Tax=Cylindrobasidium torrendii FP15055 ss-10 TaxID=1314674 RepID=A0A0D7AS31_9AGAR|nr:hypothetical protein CYLTODRAFT_460196 [Cylindrobasidium torrendii FP15055 ss-10]
MATLVYPVVDFELGTAQKYTDPPPTSPYVPGSWVLARGVVKFKENALEEWLVDVRCQFLRSSLAAMGVRTAQDLVTVACVLLEYKIYLRHFRLGLEVALRDSWLAFKKVAHLFARPAIPRAFV